MSKEYAQWEKVYLEFVRADIKHTKSQIAKVDDYNLSDSDREDILNHYNGQIDIMHKYIDNVEKRLNSNE